MVIAAAEPNLSRIVTSITALNLPAVAMTAILPPFPRFVFAVFEPITLFAGAFASIAAPTLFSANQIPGSPVKAITGNDLMTTIQLGNLYVLCALVGIGVLYTTTEPKVVRGYLLGLMVADIGHVAATYYILGTAKFLDYTDWNAQTAGNIAATSFLFSVRCGYLLGIFGPDRKPASAKGPKSN